MGLRGPWILYFLLEAKATDRFMHIVVDVLIPGVGSRSKMLQGDFVGS
jgi:hypothetical protein